MSHGHLHYRPPQFPSVGLDSSECVRGIQVKVEDEDRKHQMGPFSYRLASSVPSPEVVVKKENYWLVISGNGSILDK